MKRRFFLFLPLFASLAAGCSQLPVFGGDNEARQVSELLAWSQRVAQLSADEQRKEMAGVGQAYARERSVQARLKLALLLAQPGSAVNDDARAVGLLEPFANIAPGSGPLRQFGGLLYVQVGERVKEQRRAQQMKEQLDALRAVERNLLEREQSRTK